MIVFTWICRLDKKYRLVIPEKARREFNISDLVLMKLSAKGLVVNRAETDSGIIVSKNCRRVQ